MGVFMPEIKSDQPSFPVFNRGNGERLGRNKLIFSKMKPGDSIWEVPKKKMLSLANTAKVMGIKIRVRKLPEGRNYAIWRLV